MSDLNKVAKSVSGAFGWSYDFTRDVIATAGGAILIWFGVKFGLTWMGAGAGFTEIAATIAAGIASASLWLRNRRDNLFAQNRRQTN